MGRPADRPRCACAATTRPPDAAQYPDRFAGSFVLPLQDLKRSLGELERAVTKLGLRVANAARSTAGLPGDPVFHPFWKRSRRRASRSGPPEGTRSLVPALCAVELRGQSIEEAKCLTSLVYEGVMHRYPKLKVVIGARRRLFSALLAAWTAIPEPSDTVKTRRQEPERVPALLPLRYLRVRSEGAEVLLSASAPIASCSAATIRWAAHPVGWLRECG